MGNHGFSCLFVWLLQGSFQFERNFMALGIPITIHKFLGSESGLQIVRKYLGTPKSAGPQATYSVAWIPTIHQIGMMSSLNLHILIDPSSYKEKQICWSTTLWKLPRHWHRNTLDSMLIKAQWDHNRRSLRYVRNLQDTSAFSSSSWMPLACCVFFVFRWSTTSFNRHCPWFYGIDDAQKPCYDPGRRTVLNKNCP